MALLIYEGFDNWAVFGTSQIATTNGDTVGKGWTTSLLSSLSAGTLGGKKASFSGGGFVRYQAAFTITGTDSFIVGTRYNNPSTAFPANAILAFLDSAGATQCGLDTNTAGKLIFWRGTSATVLGTGTTTLIPTADNYIEVKAQFSNSANIEVRMNGATEITLTGVDDTNTANQNATFVQYMCASNATTHDDVYICDSTGSAPYNDFLCGSGGSFLPVRVETLFGTTNNSVQWTPNASTNVSRINEAAMDSDTTYNSDNVVGHIDTFNHGALVSTPSTIFCVMLENFVRKDDVSIKTFRSKLLSGAATQNGTTFAATTVYQMFQDFYNNDPNTGLAWANATAVNNTQYGYELVS